MQDWIRIAEFPAEEQTKLRWLLRHAASNGIVADGVAIKLGREWRINLSKLPEFLRRQTLAALGGSR